MSVTTNRFTGKVVLVTGGGSGIGAATAQRFAAEGATVVIIGRRIEALERTITSAETGTFHAMTADVSDWHAVVELVGNVIAEHGRLDVLVNSAGTISRGTIADVSPDEWRQVIGTDLNGAFYCMKAALPHLLKSRGSIINVSSVSGVRGDWSMAAYNAAKGGLSNLTRAAAMDHAKDGVRINAVAPTFTLTEMTDDIKDDPAVNAAMSNRIPLGRPAEAHELASVIAFLASEDASYITGAVVPVDGGLTASNGQPNQS